MLHCTDLIRFLLLKEKKQREELEEKEEELEWKRHSKLKPTTTKVGGCLYRADLTPLVSQYFSEVAKGVQRSSGEIRSTIRRKTEVSQTFTFPRKS